MDLFLRKRSYAKYIADLVLWSSMTIVAFAIRLEGELQLYSNAILYATLIAVPVKAVLIKLFNLHRHSWSNVTLPDLWDLITALTVFYGAFLITIIALYSYFVIPLSIPIIEFFTAITLLTGLRVACRIYFQNSSSLHYEHFKGKEKKNTRILIIGAGNAGTMVAKEMLKDYGRGMEPVGFLDDDISKLQQRYVGLPVLGTVNELEKVALQSRIDQVLIAIPSGEGKVIRLIVEKARAINLDYKILPGIYDLLNNRISISHIRDVDVEDLLRRKPVELDAENIEAYVKNKRILVTGAGGSIGSEMVRQILGFEPKKLLLVGRGENSIFQINQELRKSSDQLDIDPIICDIRDWESLEKLFQKEYPEVIFHAAAHKHVPLMETNPSQAIFNNIGGTKNLVELALEYKVERFVNISTDKAVNPANIMGASKRVAEKVVEWGAKRAGHDQVFVSVRFGNVLGSRGSVVPIFKEQIKNGGPVTVTHPHMKRYFMTIPEASQLVLQAGAMNINGAVFVLDMGEPIRIVDMAYDLIRLSGLEPGKDIEVVITEARQGEKLFEQLLTNEEGTGMTRHEKIFVARKNGVRFDNFEQELDDLFAAAREFDPTMIKYALKRIVPAYTDSIESVAID